MPAMAENPGFTSLGGESRVLPEGIPEARILVVKVPASQPAILPIAGME